MIELGGCSESNQHRPTVPRLLDMPAEKVFDWYVFRVHPYRTSVSVTLDVTPELWVAPVLWKIVVYLTITQDAIFMYVYIYIYQYNNIWVVATQTFFMFTPYLGKWSNLTNIHLKPPTRYTYTSLHRVGFVVDHDSPIQTTWTSTLEMILVISCLLPPEV